MEHASPRATSMIVFALSLGLLVLGAPGMAWDASAGHAVIAAHGDHLAAAPLYGVLARAAATLPFGELAFRLAILGAVLGALTLAGVVAAARALLPKHPDAGVLGALLLVLAPPFREAAGFATPSILAACGAVWTLAAALDHARTPSTRAALHALAATGLVIGSSPWVGVVLAVVVVAWLARTGADRGVLALAIAALGVLAVALWATAIGRFPGLAPNLAALVASSGEGAAAVLIGSGLLGAAFGAATGLPRARPLVLAIVAVAATSAVADPAPAPLLAVLAVGVAVIPSAVARAVQGTRETLVLAGAGVPLLVMALLVGPAFGVDDPRGAPARLARDVIDALPPGPGALVITRATPWAAINYAQDVAGARPDLPLAPPLPPLVADAFTARHLRAQDIVGSDAPAIGRLDPMRAVPRGRGFELRLALATTAVPPPPPARYASAIGEQQAIALAITRARYEAGSGRLDAAARAAGLLERFRAADLAILATSLPTRERPALFGFIPRFPDEDPRTRLALFGDDLAWVAGVEQPVVDAPRSRRLHALWREVLRGGRKPDDPAIAALGAEAVAATRELMATFTEQHP